MTESTTSSATTLTEQIDSKKDESGESVPVPAAQPAEIQQPAPGEALLTVQLTLKEIGATSACIATSVHAGWIKNLSDLNTVNSVLRKFHDAKQQYVKEHP